MARSLKLEVLLSAVDKVTAPLKKITTGTGKTADALRASRDELKRLQKAQKDLDSFTQLKRSSEASSQALEDQQRQVRELTQQIKTTEGPTKRLTQQREAAIRQARKLKSQYQDEQRELQTLRHRVRSVDGVTGTYSEQQRELANRIQQANNRLEDQKQGLRDIERRQQRATEAAKRYQRALSRGQNIAGRGAMGAAAGGGATLAMGHQALINQSSGARLAAQQGEGAEEADRYREVITHVYTTGRGQGLEQVTEAVAALSAQFGSLGETSNEQLQTITRQALTLSDAFGLDIAESVQTAGIMVRNGLAANASDAFDLMTRGMQEVSVSMRHELPEILHEYGTNFRALGFDGKESLNMLVAAAEQGRFALDKTGDALKEFTIRGSDMSTASVDAYEAMGLNAQAMADAIAGGGDRAGAALTTTAQKLLEIENPAARANAAIALFGTPIEDLSVDQIPAFLRGLTQTDDRIRNVTGATREMGDTLDNNAGDALKRVQRALASSFMGVLDEVDDTIIRVSNRVTSWMRQNPELTSTLTKVAMALGVLTAIGGTALVVLGSLLGPLAMIRMGATLLGPTLLSASKAMMWLGGAVKGLGALLLANPIGIAIVAAVAVIAGAAYLIYRHWEPIKTFFINLWNQLTAAFGDGIGGVAKLLYNWTPYGLIYRAFTNTLERLGVDIPANFRDLGSAVVDGLIGGLTSKFNELRERITGMAGNVRSWFADVLDINSPSRVFTQLGGYTVDGLNQGLDAQRDEPARRIQEIARRVSRAGAGLALGAATLPAVAMPNIEQQTPIQFDNRPPLTATSTQASGFTMGDININVTPAPGMNEQQLAQYVAQEVQRALTNAQRDAQARQRSSLRDLD